MIVYALPLRVGFAAQRAKRHSLPTFGDAICPPRLASLPGRQMFSGRVNTVAHEHERQATAEELEIREDPAADTVSHLSDGIGPLNERPDSSLAGTMRAGEAGSIPDGDKTRWRIEVGSDVIGKCGHKIGEVVAIRDDLIVVEKGFFMPVDFYIPKSAILRNNEHGLYLNVTKNEALHNGWDVDPRLARAS